MIFFPLLRLFWPTAPRRARGQSLVELALVAPILILLAMAVFLPSMILNLLPLGALRAYHVSAQSAGPRRRHRASAPRWRALGWVRQPIVGIIAHLV